MMRCFLLLSALAATAVAQSSLVTTEMMGTKSHFMVDWKKGADVKYPMQDFSVGDMVTLTWQGFHDAVVVPDSQDPCATAKSAYISVLSPQKDGGVGNYNITADTPENFWIICTVGQHCSAGNQKVMFMLKGSSSNSSMTPGMMMTPPSPPKSNSSSSSGAVVASSTSAILAIVFAVVGMLAVLL